MQCLLIDRNNVFLLDKMNTISLEVTKLMVIINRIPNHFLPSYWLLLHDAQSTVAEMPLSLCNQYGDVPGALLLCSSFVHSSFSHQPYLLYLHH